MADCHSLAIFGDCQSDLIKGTRVGSWDQAAHAAGKVKHSWTVEGAMGKHILSDEASVPIRSFKVRCLQKEI